MIKIRDNLKIPQNPKIMAIKRNENKLKYNVHSKKIFNHNMNHDFTQKIKIKWITITGTVSRFHKFHNYNLKTKRKYDTFQKNHIITPKMYRRTKTPTSSTKKQEMGKQ